MDLAFTKSTMLI